MNCIDRWKFICRKGYYVVWSTQRDFTDEDLQKRVDHLELYLLRAKEIGLKKLVRKSCQKGVSQEIMNELWKGATELKKLIKDPIQYSSQVVQCFVLSILKSFDQNLQDLARKKVEKKEKKMFVAPLEIYVESFEFIEPIVHINLKKKSDDEIVAEIPDSKEDLGVEDPQSPEVKKRKHMEEQKKKKKLKRVVLSRKIEKDAIHLMEKTDKPKKPSKKKNKKKFKPLEKKPPKKKDNITSRRVSCIKSSLGNLLPRKPIVDANNRLHFVNAVWMKFQEFCVLTALMDMPDVWDDWNSAFYDLSMLLIMRKVYQVDPLFAELKQIPAKGRRNQAQQERHEKLHAMTNPFKYIKNSLNKNESGEKIVSNRKKIVDYIEKNLQLFWDTAEIATCFDLEADLSIIPMMIAMLDAEAVKNRTNFKLYMLKTIPSHMSRIVAGYLKSTGIHAAMPGYHEIIARVRSRIRKIFNALCKKADVSRGNGDQGQETEVIEEDPEIVESEQEEVDDEDQDSDGDDPQILDNDEDERLEEMESDVHVNPTDGLEKMIDVAFKKIMRWTVPATDMRGEEKYYYTPTDQLILFIKTIVIDTTLFPSNLTEIDEDFVKTHWKQMEEFYKTYSVTACPRIRISPSPSYSRRYNYWGHAALTAFPDGVKEVDVPVVILKEFFDSVHQTSWGIRSTSELVATQERTEKLKNTLDMIMQDLKTHIGCMSHLHFGKTNKTRVNGFRETIKDPTNRQAKPSSVPSIDAARELYKKIFAIYTHFLNRLKNLKGINTKNPYDIPKFMTDTIEDILHKRYRLVFGIDSDGVGATIRYCRWCPLSRNTWRIRNGEDPIGNEMPSFVGENTPLNPALSDRIRRFVYDDILGGDPGHNVPCDFSSYKPVTDPDGITSYKLDPTAHTRITAGMIKNFTGSTKHAREMERQKKIILTGPGKSINQIESEIIPWNGSDHYLRHLIQFFENYDILQKFYSKQKFAKARLTRYFRKYQCLDDWIKKNLFHLADHETMNDFINRGKKILIVWGNGQWKYDSGLRLCGAISSSRQIAVRLQFLIHQHNLILYQRTQKYWKTREYFEQRGLKDTEEYRQLLLSSKFLESHIDFLKASEMYTSQICNTCHHKSLKKTWRQVKKQRYTISGDGEEQLVEELRWTPTRTFQCSHSSHVGSRKMNRDTNASANIVLNVILFASDALDDTTWKIGKNEV